MDKYMGSEFEAGLPIWVNLTILLANPPGKLAKYFCQAGSRPLLFKAALSFIWWRGLGGCVCGAP